MIDVILPAAMFASGFLVGLAVAAVGARMLVGLYRDERAIVNAEREQWRSERREWANRIQHPNLVPTGTAPAPRQRDPQVAERLREWASVGRVTAGNGDAEDPELP